MKVIPTNDLILILQNHKLKAYSENNIMKIFEWYGDDFFLVDGVMDLANENEKRKQLIKEVLGEVTENEKA